MIHLFVSFWLLLHPVADCDPHLASLDTACLEGRMRDPDDYDDLVYRHPPGPPAEVDAI